MREFFYIKPRELILFAVFGLIYIGVQLGWTLGAADNTAVISNTQSQSVGKMVLIGTLTLTAVLYAVVSMWFAWRAGEQSDRPPGLFLVKLGMAMVIYICLGQLIAVATPEWRSPTQGVPVMYTLCLGGFIGIVLAGIGGDMLWKNKRETFLAQTAKRR